MSEPVPGAGDLESVFRAEHGRVVAALVARLGDIDLAEEMTQEAFVEALQRWPRTGVPANPGAWLTVTARHRAIDRVRRESQRDARHRAAHHLYGEEDAMPAESPTAVGDERLRLLFTCCHPALATDAQVALTLRLLAGLSVAEVADAFLVPERTMAQRITRAKRKIRAARIPFVMPPDADLPARLRGVLATVYLVFTAGYLPRSGEAVGRPDLCQEAVRLGRVLRDLRPHDPEVVGLLALMLLTDARRTARVVDGVLVPLDEQDRSTWDHAAIAEGHDLVRWCLRRARPGPYQLLAAIAAVHTDAARAQDTDWGQVRALYDQLFAVMPTPVVALNRAIAVAEVDGPAAGLEVVEDLDLAGYQPYHATRADLLRRLGRTDEAVAAYDRAVELTDNLAQVRFLRSRRDSLR